MTAGATQKAGEKTSKLVHDLTEIALDQDGHRTGWTALVANLIFRRYRQDIPAYWKHHRNWDNPSDLRAHIGGPRLGTEGAMIDFLDHGMLEVGIRDHGGYFDGFAGPTPSRLEVEDDHLAGEAVSW